MDLDSLDPGRDGRVPVRGGNRSGIEAGDGTGLQAVVGQVLAAEDGVARGEVAANSRDRDCSVAHADVRYPIMVRGFDGGAENQDHTTRLARRLAEGI